MGAEGPGVVPRGREFVDAARSLGASPLRIVLRHILPNILPLMIIYISLTIPGLILAHVVYGLPITTLIFRNYYAEVPTEMVELSEG